MALAAISYKGGCPGFRGHGTGEMGRGLVVRAVSWLENEELFYLPTAYIKALSSFVCT